MDTIKMHLPDLQEGSIYQQADVRDYIYIDSDGCSDYDLTAQNFPLSVGEKLEADLLSCRQNEKMFVEYQVFPILELEDELQKLEERFKRNDAKRDEGTTKFSPGFRMEKERDRVQRIVEMLLRGDVIYPVFIQKNDPHRRIIEGGHRALAIKQLGWGQLPTFLAGYRDWF